MSTDSVWEFTKDFYEKELGVPKRVVEFLAVIDVIGLVASGHSNRTISNTLEKMSESYIESICKRFLAFDGWEEDLDVNVYFVYKNTGKNLEGFNAQVENITPLLKGNDIFKAYEVCSMFENMKKEINTYYG